MEIPASAKLLIIPVGDDPAGYVKIDCISVKNAAKTLRAINHTLRQRVIRLLAENGKMNVTDIYIQLRLTSRWLHSN